MSQKMSGPREDMAMAVKTFVALAAHTQGASIDALAAATSSDEHLIRQSLDLLQEIGLAEEDPQYAFRYRLADSAAALGLAGRYVEMRRLAWPHLQALHHLTRQRVSLHVLEGCLQRAIDECPREPQSALRERPLLGYRDGRILRFGSTALVLLAFLPRAEAEAVLAMTARPPTADEIAVDPQYERFRSAGVDQAAWDAATTAWSDLEQIRAQGYAVSRPGGRSSMGGEAITAAIFERGGRVCAGLCVFDRPTDGVERDTIPDLLETAGKISRAFGFVPPR